MAEPFLAYISQGQLYLHSDVARVVESPFGRTLRERAIEIYNRHAWKTQGRGGQSLTRALRAPTEPDPAEFRIEITGVSRGSHSGEIFYTLETDDICGVFIRNRDGVERRLFHTADYRLRQPDVHPDGSEIAVSAYYRNGAANLALVTSDGSTVTEITDGDSLDEAPRWAPGPGRRLVFQSAGMARGPGGRFSGHGPFSIQQLDLATGDMHCLGEDAQFDFLWPRFAADGSLYYVRRPTEFGPPKPVSPWRAFGRFLLWPFRFVIAIALLVDMFVGSQTGRRLYNPKAPDKRVAAPPTWQLMRRSADSTAAPEAIAEGVQAYDLSSDGSVVYTNGFDVYRLTPGNGHANKLLTGTEIDLITAL